MTPNLFSFTGQTPSDPTYQAGMNQYVQQGQNLINPGQAQIGASNPISASGYANLANALQQASSTPQLPAQAAQQGLMGSAQMGQPGPTPQALALAQGLQPQPMVNNTQQFMNPQGGY